MQKTQKMQKKPILSCVSLESFVSFVSSSSPLHRLFDLLLQRTKDECMARVVEDFQNEPILEAQTVEEIGLGEDRILHVLHRWVLSEECLEHFFLHIADQEEVDLALRSAECAGKQDQLHVGQRLQAGDERALALNRLGK